MIEKIDDVILHLTKIELLLEECDEWTNAHQAYILKQQIIELYGTSDEVRGLQDEIEDKIVEAESLCEGSKLELTKLTQLGVEESRELAIKIRAGLVEYAKRVSERETHYVETLDDAQLLEYIKDMSKTGVQTDV